MCAVLAEGLGDWLGSLTSVATVTTSWVVTWWLLRIMVGAMELCCAFPQAVLWGCLAPSRHSAVGCKESTVPKMNEAGEYKRRWREAESVGMPNRGGGKWLDKQKHSKMCFTGTVSAWETCR